MQFCWQASRPVLRFQQPTSSGARPGWPGQRPACWQGRLASAPHAWEVPQLTIPSQPGQAPELLVLKEPELLAAEHGHGRRDGQPVKYCRSGSSNPRSGCLSLCGSPGLAEGGSPTGGHLPWGNLGHGCQPGVYCLPLSEQKGCQDRWWLARAAAVAQGQVRYLRRCD